MTGRRFLVPALLALFVGSAAGQSPPTDLTELNLEEILALHIRRAGEEAKSSPWSVGYRLVWARFDGNRDGTDDVSLEEIIFRPGTEDRTRDNFPVVPLVINQQAHLFEIGYDATDRLSLRLLIPVVLQDTDHVSVVPGFDEFLIKSSGLGDVQLSASYPVWNSGNQHLLITGGASLPLGSIDETGPTPRDATMDTQLPYTMQIGSGTFDVMPGLAFAGHRESLRYGSQLRGTLRLGESDRDYTLGNRLSLSVWASQPVTDWLEPSVTLLAQNWGEIDGEDTSLSVPVPGFPYPAAVTDPSKFGGKKVVAQIGAAVTVPGDPLEGLVLDIEAGLPVFQDLNGPQPKEVWRFSVGWNWDL